ncbi:MAG: molybdenum cofactor guanylyltransferase [Ornithinimicrobium sp.]
MNTVDAMVLVGGRGTRLGGVDKAMLVIEGQTLLDRVLTALGSVDERAGMATIGQVVVVGRAEVPAWVRCVVEEPPGSGPVAAICAGLTSLAHGRSASRWTLVIAVDQPHAADVVPLLCAAIDDAESITTGHGARALVPVDREGRWQWLLAAYRTVDLVRAIGRLDDVAGAPMHRVFSQLTAQVAEVDDDLLGDIDTPADLLRWGGEA